MFNKVQLLEIDEGSEGQRLDNFLLKTLKGAPRSLIYRIIRKGEVRVNKGRAKPETKLSLGDMVRVPPVKLADKQVQHKPGAGLISVLDRSVVYESDRLLVINKPSGLAVHGGSGVNLGLIEALRAREGAPKYLELVHRLDKETSGCVMVAKKRSMLTYLQDLLRKEGRINKRYLALVQGQWSKRKLVVDAPLYKHEAKGGERRVSVDHRQGKSSRTQFRLLESFQHSSLVEAKPMTGRTHQIRVHALHEDHPLVGDDKYGDPDFNQFMKAEGVKRLFLHAFALSVPMPDGSTLELEAPLPGELEKALVKLRR